MKVDRCNGDEFFSFSPLDPADNFGPFAGEGHARGGGASNRGNRGGGVSFEQVDGRIDRRAAPLQRAAAHRSDGATRAGHSANRNGNGNFHSNNRGGFYPNNFNQNNHQNNYHRGDGGYGGPPAQVRSFFSVNETNLSPSSAELPWWRWWCLSEQSG